MNAMNTLGTVTSFVWFTIIVLVILYEFWTVWKFTDGAKPLTNVYYRLSCKKWFRVMVFPFFTWMLWHWIIQPYFWRGYLWVDFTFVAAGAVIGVWIHPPKNMVRCD